MRKIYTRTGDDGTTGIFGGERVAKDNVRVEANGNLDELNSVIGLIRTMLDKEHKWQTLLKDIQIEIMSMMSITATPEVKRKDNPNRLRPEITTDMEYEMDIMTAAMSDNGYFILPGGTTLSAWLHMARVSARKAERRLVSLHRTDRLPEDVLKFINRLSDLFFIMARYELFNNGQEEEKWKEFGYKRKTKTHSVTENAE